MILLPRRYIVKKISSASANAAIFGVPKMFVPRWKSWNWNKNMSSKGEAEQGIMQQQPQYLFDPGSWTYLYDHSPLAKTLDKYIDYKKLNLVQDKKNYQKFFAL